jgi:hypothetical protein
LQRSRLSSEGSRLKATEGGVRFHPAAQEKPQASRIPVREAGTPLSVPRAGRFRSAAAAVEQSLTLIFAANDAFTYGATA